MQRHSCSSSDHPVLIRLVTAAALTGGLAACSDSPTRPHRADASVSAPDPTQQQARFNLSFAARDAAVRIVGNSEDPDARALGQALTALADALEGARAPLSPAVSQARARLDSLQLEQDGLAPADLDAIRFVLTRAEGL